MSPLLSNHVTVTPQGDRIYRDDQRPAAALEWETRWNVRIVDAGSVQSEGLPPGALPPIDSSAMLGVEAARNGMMAAASMVRVRLGSQVVWFPLRILAWHRSLNVTIGAESLLVTYCPLSDRVEAYRRRLAGQELHFAAAGIVNRGASPRVSRSACAQASSALALSNP